MSDPKDMNETEISYLIRCQTGLIIKRSVGKARLLEIYCGLQPMPEEICETTNSRKHLQVWIEKNWEGINSQLPCKGENRGKCTIYPCPEGRHLDCLSAAKVHMI